MATKPQRTQAKQVYAFVGSTPTRRVQSFDWASNFTIDSVFELGNAGIVEDAITLVESGVTLNSNEWGTTDLEAMIFGIYEQRNILGNGKADGPVGPNTTVTIHISTYGAGGVWSGAATNNYLQIIRTSNNATTSVTEYSKVTSNTYKPASLCHIVRLETALGAAPGTADMVTLINGYTINQDTVDSNPVHFILPHRYSATSTNIMHSVLLPRCYADSLTYRIDTGGGSEQNYSLVGEEERLLLGSRREVTQVTGSFIKYNGSSGSLGTLQFRVPLDSLAATGSPYALYAGSELLKWTGAAGGTIAHSSGAATVDAYFPTGKGFDSNTQLVYYTSDMTPKGYKTLTNITSSIGKLTKGYVEIWMDLAGASAEKLLRCTGIDISIPLTRESIDELGETRTIGKPLEGNLRNEITLTFNRNDLREYAKMLGNQVAFDAGTTTEILMTDLKTVKTVGIVVKFYNHQTTHDSTTLLKTMTFENCNFIGDNSTTPISGASGVELKFSTQSLSIVGSGLPPLYS